MLHTNRAVVAFSVFAFVLTAPVVRAQDAKQAEREAMYHQYLEFSSYVKGGSIEPHWMADASNAPTIDSNGKLGSEASVLGNGRGLAEVIVLVRDLEAARDVWRDMLGFTFPSRGGGVDTLPSGLKLSGTKFEENYLELRAIDDREKAARLRPRSVEFLEKHEGAQLILLDVSSAKSTAAFLQMRGFKVSEGPVGRVVYFKDSELLTGAAIPATTQILPTWVVVFVEYPPDPKGYMPKPEERQHANTAKGIKSVWIAVTDLKAATKAYESVGLPVGEKRRLPQLGAIGSEIKAGQGVILLLQPTSHSGKVAKFLEDRGEGIMGISIEVSRLMTARKLLQMNTKRKFTPYGGPYGMSVLIPAQITHGVWVEMFQRR